MPSHLDFWACAPERRCPPFFRLPTTSRLLAWLLARLKGLDAAREVLHYFAPVGEKQEYIDRALAHVLPVLESQATAA